MANLTLEEVLCRFHKVHGDKYDYSLINENEYTNVNQKVPIVCPKHGMFLQRASHHIEGQGCKKCAIEINAKLNSIRQKGKVPNNRAKLIFGVGINDSPTPVRVDGKLKPSYALWYSMISRCYSPKSHKRTLTYVDCSVCEEWHTFSNFEKWYNENYIENGHLDKDILIKGNKCYSPETCSFVPREINNLIENVRNKRGKTPMGVFERCGKFLSYVRVNNKRIYLGTYDTKEQAFFRMKEEKEKFIKEMAKKYYNLGKISLRTYNALMNYEIDITD